MADLVYFTPAATKSALENQKEFVRFCRDDLTVFGGDLPWSEFNWSNRARFTKLGTPKNVASENDLLDAEFIDFAKAYFRYQQGHNPTKSRDELPTLKVLEKALLQTNRNAKLIEVTVLVLDEAATLLRCHYSPAAAHKYGRQLQRLAKFVVEKQLVPNDVGSWKNPIKRPDTSIRTGAKAKAMREKKLPFEEAIDALAEIFALEPNNSRDIFTSSTAALLMCASSRISEILALQVDCEIEEKDSSGVSRYGWRFTGAKGYGCDIKWIPTEMVPIAREAISRMGKLTEPARQLAKWIEKNPERFFRHDNCPDVPDASPLTGAQICQAWGIGYDETRKGGVPQAFRKQLGEGPVTLNDLWMHAMDDLPKSFPWTSEDRSIKYSDALFCMRPNSLHKVRGEVLVKLWMPESNIFNCDVSPRKYRSYKGHKSIFDRYGYKMPDGSRIKLTSHQFRHLLDTIAQRGGLSQGQIARWAGRANPSQNRVYNHMSEFEMIAQAEALDQSKSLFGPLGKEVINQPVCVQEFNTLEKGAAHVTEFGVCIHDYTMSPCQRYRDCIICDEQVCIKGNQEQTARIRERFDLIKKQYESTEQAMRDGLAGADRWYEYHERALKRIRALLEMLDDPEVPVGAQIKLDNEGSFSLIQRALESRTSDFLPEKVAQLKNETG